MICRYCIKFAALLRLGDEGYPYQSSYGPVWTCVPCRAWVGCHDGTETALGGLANAELRAAKQAAHAAFDPLWLGKIRRDGCSKSKARKAGYFWLSQQMGVAFKECHIGFFDLDECRQVIEICSRARAKPLTNTLKESA